MINVRLYHAVIPPFFKIKHGQFAAVALTRSGANKLLKKIWDAFIIRRDRIILREHHKAVNAQKKEDTLLKSAQQSAGQQIDNRCDKNLAGLDAKVKSIIKDTVKSQSSRRKQFCLILRFLSVNLSQRLMTFIVFLNHPLKDSDIKKILNQLTSEALLIIVKTRNRIFKVTPLAVFQIPDKISPTHYLKVK